MRPHSWLKTQQHYKDLAKFSSDIEEDKSYALLSFLVDTANKAGSFVNKEGDSIRVADHIYVVGGAVRNFVIGQPVKDIDLVLDAVALSTRRVKRDAVWFADLIKKSSPGSANISQKSNEYGVEILHIHGEWIVNGVDVGGQDIEIAFARRESYSEGGWKPDEVEKATIEEDAKRREFTFNTLLWSFSDLADHGPSEDIIKDPLGTGLRDLKNNIIDTPLDPVDTFDDDASRMMRAMKFQFKYGFDIAPRVQEAINNNPENIRKVPVEVLGDLLTQTILNQATYKQALEEMKQNNMLQELIQILKENEAFRSRLKNWTEDNRDLVYLFNLIDYGLPIDDRLSFLTDEEKIVFRQKIMSMSKGDQDKYLSVSKNVGSAIKDKSFFMSTFNATREKANLSKRDIPAFRIKYYEPASRFVVLHNPEIIDDPIRLKEAILSELEKRVTALPDVEASIKTVGKLLTLSRYLMKEKNLKDANGVIELIIKKTAEDFNIDIPNLSGDVYIFDMDDTLFWTPEWHTIAETDESGRVSAVDMNFPNMLHKAVAFIERVNEDHTDFIKRDKKSRVQQDLIDLYDEEVGELRLVKDIIDIPLLGKERQVIFVLSDKNGSPIEVPILKKYFSGKYLKLFDLRGKYAPVASTPDNPIPRKAIIGGDFVFYQSPKTLGHIPNEEILKLYNAHRNNAVILTARETAEGMREGILDRLSSVGAQPPLAVFTKPKGVSSGKYKGYVIGQIAQQESVSSITFYDDNLKYINDVNKVLQEEYGPKAFSKVDIHKVDVSKKPEESLLAKLSHESKNNILINLIKVANSLDAIGLYGEADQIDKIMEEK